MSKVYKVVIVGGGASGLMTAVELLSGNDKLSGSDVVILERLDRVGKKLIATGNGQGNLSNAQILTENYHGDIDFINAFIEFEKNLNIEAYLSNLGIPLVTDKEGRKYPLSKQASAVLDVIRAFLLRNNVGIKTGFLVDNIVKEKGVYELFSNGEIILAKTVVLSTGGKSQKQFGTDGTAYKLAQSFGHELTKTYPALVQLKTETNKIRGLKGIKEYAKAYAYNGDKLLSQTEGDIIFTEFGVSGNATFKLSSYLVATKDPVIKLEFLPDLSISQVEDLLLSRSKLDYIDSSMILCGILNKRVGEAVIKTAKSLKAKDVAFALKNFTLPVTGSLGYDYSQVTKGGIKTDKINPKTYESLLSKELYITGEMLDVDGDCGGYNVTFAFCSGIACAKNIKLNLKNA